MPAWRCRPFQMHPFIYKAVPALLVFVLIVHQINHQWTKVRPQRHLTIEELQRLHHDREHESSSQFDAADLNGWHFDWTVDGNNRGLSDCQCDAAFPDLYAEIDRAEAKWQGRNITRDTIALSETDQGGVRVLLKDGELRILETKGMYRKDFRSRIVTVLYQIDSALTHADHGDAPFPDTEFSIVVGDYVTLPPGREYTTWSFTRDVTKPRQEELWVIPDFNFWSSGPSDPSFTELQTSARQHDSSVADKIQQIVWRGVIWTNPAIRKALLHVTENQSWANVKDMSWKMRKGGGKGKGKGGKANVLDGWGQLLSSKTLSKTTNILPPEQFCDYAFVCNTEGRSWSSRLTLMLNCDSVPVSHHLNWVTHFSHLLRPFQNYVPVERDFNDLPEKIQHYLGDPAAAQEIADNARRTFRERYTTPAATSCYWRRLLKTWARVAQMDSATRRGEEEQGQPWKSVVEREVPGDGTSSSTSTWNSSLGIAFHDFLLADQTVDYPPPNSSG